MPRGTIDGVIQGHRHTMAHYYYKGIPIVGAINGGYYFHVLRFEMKNWFGIKNIVSSSIEGPIPVCEKIFAHTKRCNYIEE